MLPYLYDVDIATTHPVIALPGQRLVVRPGHERPIVVVERAGGDWRPVRIGPPNFGALIDQEARGAIRCVFPTFASLADHPAVRRQA